MSAGEPQIECLSMNREGALTSHGSDPMPAGGGSTCSQVLDALKGLCFCYNLYIYIYQKSRGCIAINHINRDSRRLIRGEKKSTLSHTLRESVFWFNGLAEHASVVTSDVRRHRAHGFLRHMTPARAPSNSLGMGINLNGT